MESYGIRISPYRGRIDAIGEYGRVGEALTKDRKSLAALEETSMLEVV